jgi:hypothetical protein
MATRSMIGILNADKTITASYCHCDGYLENNGRILTSHYTDEAKIRELLQYGSMSSLGENIHPDSQLTHNFDNKQKGVCVFYGRDRGDNDSESVTYQDLQDYMGDSEEYNYLWNGKEWEYLSDDTYDTFQPVLAALEALDNE